MRVWYVEKRRQRYHFRARVPGDIAAVTGRSHVIVSLRTGDLGQAKIISARIFFLLASSYDQIRAKMREFFTPAEPDAAEAQRLGERIFALGAEYEARRNALIEEFSARRQAIVNEVFGLQQSFTAGFHIRGGGDSTSTEAFSIRSAIRVSPVPPKHASQIAMQSRTTGLYLSPMTGQ